MRWTVLVDVDIADERVPDMQLLLYESMTVLTGFRPVLKTIRTAQLELLLKPPATFAEPRRFYGR